MVLVGCNGSRDIDNDLIPDIADNCHLDYNPTQANSDNDGLGNACDWDEFVRFTVVPEDLQGLRYRLHATFPTWYYAVGAIALSVESYVPLVLETEFDSAPVEQTPGLFPHKTSTFTIYGLQWEEWEDELYFTEFNDSEVDLGVFVFSQPQPPPTR